MLATVRFTTRVLLFGVAMGCTAIGCADSKAPAPPAAAAPTGKALGTTETPKAEVKEAKTTAAEDAKEDEAILATRNKLSPEDRKLVDAQEWCVINNEERLGGSMGAPVKLMIKGEPVFICCKSCKKEAEAEPEKTLAKLAELKAKKKAAGDKK